MGRIPDHYWDEEDSEAEEAHCVRCSKDDILCKPDHLNPEEKAERCVGSLKHMVIWWANHTFTYCKECWDNDVRGCRQMKTIGEAMGRHSAKIVEEAMMEATP